MQGGGTQAGLESPSGGDGSEGARMPGWQGSRGRVPRKREQPREPWRSTGGRLDGGGHPKTEGKLCAQGRVSLFWAEESLFISLLKGRPEMVIRSVLLRIRLLGESAEGARAGLGQWLCLGLGVQGPGAMPTCLGVGTQGRGLCGN